MGPRLHHLWDASRLDSIPWHGRLRGLSQDQRALTCHSKRARAWSGRHYWQTAVAWPEEQTGQWPGRIGLVVHSAESSPIFRWDQLRNTRPDLTAYSCRPLHKILRWFKVSQYASKPRLYLLQLRLRWLWDIPKQYLAAFWRRHTDYHCNSFQYCRHQA